MKFELTPYTIHELGQRQNQEDSIFPAHGKSTATDRLFILCDGMGGHEKGEVASATVCETMSQTILSRWNPDEPLSDDLLLQAIEAAYDALDAKDNGEAKKMGTTMTCVCFHSQGVTVAHIGDSRVYQLRPANGDEPAHILFKTRDHSLVNDLIKIGEITEEEAKNHPQKNVITRAMQPCQERRAKADIAHLTDIHPGDYFYMCSDGMLEQTSDDNLLFIITNPKVTDKQKVEMLRNVTEENKDNHTAHLIYINKVENKVEAPSPVAAPKPSEPNGVLVTPDDNHSTKSNKLYIIAAAALALIALAFVAYTLLVPSSEEPDTESEDTLNTEHIVIYEPSTEDEDSVVSEPDELSEEEVDATVTEQEVSEAQPEITDQPETTAEPSKAKPSDANSSDQKKDAAVSRFIKKENTTNK